MPSKTPRQQKEAWDRATSHLREKKPAKKLVHLPTGPEGDAIHEQLMAYCKEHDIDAKTFVSRLIRKACGVPTWMKPAPKSP